MAPAPCSGCRAAGSPVNLCALFGEKPFHIQLTETRIRGHRHFLTSPSDYFFFLPARSSYSLSVSKLFYYYFHQPARLSAAMSRKKNLLTCLGAFWGTTAAHRTNVPIPSPHRRDPQHYPTPRVTTTALSLSSFSCYSRGKQNSE